LLARFGRGGRRHGHGGHLCGVDRSRSDAKAGQGPERTPRTVKGGHRFERPKKRAQIVRRSDTTDAIRSILNKLKVLQDSQLADAQQKLAQGGIRNKEWAVAIIFGRMVAPIMLGGLAAIVIYWMNYFPEWTDLKSSWVSPPPWAWAIKGRTFTSRT
jgi:hypothetical protein